MQHSHSLALVAAERGLTLHLRIDVSTQVLCRVGLSVESVQRPDDTDAIRFAVSDNGTGMDADTVERLLSPFAQVDQFTIRRFDGAGLGLSICKELADLMGGKVLVESEPGVGSVFFLDLPGGRGPGVTPCYASHGVFVGYRLFIHGGVSDFSEAVLGNLAGAELAAKIGAADLVLILDVSDPPTGGKPKLRLVMGRGWGLPSWLHHNAVAAAVADVLVLDAKSFQPRVPDDAPTHALISR